MEKPSEAALSLSGHPLILGKVPDGHRLLLPLRYRR